ITSTYFPSRPAYFTLPSYFTSVAATEFYTLSLHDALPISLLGGPLRRHEHSHLDHLQGWEPGGAHRGPPAQAGAPAAVGRLRKRSEEHTSELQSREKHVCRLLLEKKNNPS